ncbi:DUF2309 domain-containing protein [Lutimaribacter sp. EGI FJ00015]|uniref:DUF2309 domain-containing protein n=1 Tax=Lutimaribacter degradans TaxID=2945989 RepID=A0ACC5ZY11_9RHOB|nr:DUF2309 domain-containing protein [Lutimaribacter sp. EGI FJ00013]MCM2563227.1 DUF2309 domain-containing protein [Lutimaribacter sp. EGI FJ00013]MCO0614450.1 DUF2309 domain-containing protein [Lutimaribacter sp. EGI FJ00015]MCO0635949.1 DUF2309 domain-containing protein [Lutimaribacter sp. EGI FJ00014]
MSAPNLHFTGPALELFAAANQAVGQIPPAFPLEATVAVNPFLGQTGEPRGLTAARMAKVAGLRIFPARDEIANRIARGEIPVEALESAATSNGMTVSALRDAARHPAPMPDALPTVTDLAAQATGIGWPEFLADRIGAWAAVHFDKGQAFWPAPDQRAYTAWKAFASRDLTPGIAGLTGFAGRVAALPDEPRLAFLRTCAQLGVTPEAAPLYFHRLLMTLQGWGQYARHLGWLAERDGGQDDTLVQMLTIRLAWDAALLEHFGPEIADTWTEALARYAEPLAPSADDLLDAALQDAADRAAEQALIGTIAPAPVDDSRPAIQATFCIDVRSEVFRRALEQADSGIRTKGFAGFFGLAVTHRAHASDVAEARAPVLLNPALQSDASDSVLETATRITRRGTRAWGRFKMAAVSAFAFVEAAGPLYIGKLVKDALARARTAPVDPAPQLDLPLDDRVAAAAQVLRAMSLTNGFARLVLIAGHGATVTNTPHASALQCGACGGHAGDVNARLLAALLNDTELRAGLIEQGIEVPADTLFVAGLHDTVSDRLTLFDLPEAGDHAADLARLRSALTLAGQTARAERARTLPRGTADTLARRGGDWSELRPEWGLAGCNAFIAAPRRATAGSDLGGRVFLHDYDWQDDRDFATLELIMTAPVVVASWISLQYYGSSVAHDAFGAGNKLIHNVTGGIGVVEGNGGMLRAGLPLQSVHDGDGPRHAPERLSVVLAAPRQAIMAVLERHADLRALFDNGWLALLRMNDAGLIVDRYEGGVFRPVADAAAQAQVA